jgi:aminopeptidase N
VRILVQIPAATQYVVLNSRGLNVSAAAAQVGQDVVHATSAPRTSHGGREPEELVLTFDRPLPTGEAVLELTFDGEYCKSLAGLYRVNEGGRWYAYTQFEATDARRAFPSFDEPAQKVPFDVHITTPKGLLAFSNMPESGRTDRTTAAGPTTTFDFQTSPPLPTYLVAFAVGEFDVRQGQTAPVPIRLITPKGKSDLGAIALEDTAAIVKELGGYFGVTYPYPKLDIVAVPNFSSGAMENAGLITFREELLLLDPVHAPQRARMATASVIAHELAHHWFGDLVTTAWWDDIWLNEGFATWAETKIVESYRPTYHRRLSALGGYGEVMATDSLRSARAVRQPVHSTGEAMEAFDGITYQKGAAVLGMLEHMVGSDVFQKGVEAYLRDNAWKAATANELFAALSKAAGKDVGKIAATFLDRPGVPNVTFAFDCASKPPALTLTQAPWHIFGEAPAAAATSPWIVPTDIRAEGEELRALLPDTTGSFPTRKCPAWIDPNVGGYGYYRYALDDKHWASLGAVIAKQPDTARLEFLLNLWAGVRSGSLGPEALLRALPSLDGETNRIVREKEIDILSQVEHELVTPEAHAAFASYVSARLLPRQRTLAAKSKNAKTPLTEDEALERQSIFRALGELADDPATLAEANKLTLAWLSDPTSVDGDLARAAVVLGSRKAGPDRVDALRAAMRAAKNPNDRQTAMAGLSYFDDPSTLDKGLSVALTDEIATQDVARVLFGAVYHPSTRARGTKWVMSHWDAVRARLPGFLAGRFMGLAGRACTKDEITELTAFLTPKSADLEGSARPLAEGLESAELCRLLHEKDSPAVDKFFKVKAK